MFPNVEEQVPNVGNMFPMWRNMCPKLGNGRAQCDQHVSNVTPKGEDHVPNLENISPMRGT
jgi:hypothetical protein